MTLTLDRELIEAARAGGAGMERLIATVWPDAYRIALGILHDRSLAEDAAQEACASIVGSLPGLANASAFRSWCYKIVANRAISLARKRMPTERLDALQNVSVTSEGSDAIDLRCAIAALPIDQRAAILLHYYAGFNSDEIADAIGQRPSTVRFRLMQARRALHASLTSPTSQLTTEAISDAR